MKENSLLYIFTAPIILFDVSWKEAVPERIYKIITVDRLINALKHDNLASYAEVSAYLMTASYMGPMSSEWCDIYTHVSCSILQTHFNEDHWNEVEAPRNLNQYQTERLNKLRRFIYESQIKNMRPMKKHEPVISVKPNQQLSLF